MVTSVWLLFFGFFLGFEICSQALSFGHLGRLELLGDQVALGHASAVALGCADVQPFISLHEVALYSLPGAVHGAQVMLCQRVVLLRRPAEPVNGFRATLRNAMPVEIQEAQVELSDGVASL